MKKNRFRLFFGIFSTLVVLYLILLIPEEEVSLSGFKSRPAGRSPFAWHQDEYWQYIENRFSTLRKSGRESLNPHLDSLYDEAVSVLQAIDTAEFNPDAKEFRELEMIIFEIAPYIAIMPDRYSAFATFFSHARRSLKRQSEHWDMNSNQARTTLYRLVYGGRTALEEIMLQMPPEVDIPDLTAETDEPSVSPSGTILGIPVRSGDILISRGTVPTSALIARGNDFPGNYSHAAIVYIDSVSRKIHLIESHIERGVTISTPESYLADTKFRVMALRLRSDLEVIRKNSMIPHRAAGWAFAEVKKRRIPYDFAMDLKDTAKWFCSEVVSEAYRSQGINLWMGRSYISSPGLQNWLSGFGVRNFVTQEPSDLEYDPQLRVVAEWRDMKRLWKDHYDNAVTEVLIDGANEGEPLRYKIYLLPVARILKGCSALLNLLGYPGPVPEGMSATQALRNLWYTQRHQEITEALIADAERFKIDNGYPPPYWQLVAMAEGIKHKIDGM